VHNLGPGIYVVFVCVCVCVYVCVCVLQDYVCTLCPSYLQAFVLTLMHTHKTEDKSSTKLLSCYVASENASTGLSSCDSRLHLDPTNAPNTNV